MARIEELPPTPSKSRHDGAAAPRDDSAGATSVSASASAPKGKRGFVDSLVASVFEPGVNPALVMSMHASFLLLLLTLGGLAFLTGGNGHVLTLMGCSVALWAGMGWFVLEITRVQGQQQNQPPDGSLLDSAALSAGLETQPGEEDAEVIKSEVDMVAGTAGSEGLRRR